MADKTHAMDRDQVLPRNPHNVQSLMLKIQNMIEENADSVINLYHCFVDLLTIDDYTVQDMAVAMAVGICNMYEARRRESRNTLDGLEELARKLNELQANARTAHINALNNL